MLDSIGVDQPKWASLKGMASAVDFSKQVGFPVLVRPSFVLSGAAMRVCSNNEQLERYLDMLKATGMSMVRPTSPRASVHASDNCH